MARPVNKRLGFYHIHSGEYECGMAWFDHEIGNAWYPCSKKVNHSGSCGRGDLSAY